MAGGYAGKILMVDLTTGTIRKESPSEETYRQYIGGTGLGVRMLYERMKPGVNPLGPDNMLGFVTGPLTATSCPRERSFHGSHQIALDRRVGGFKCRRVLGPHVEMGGL